MTDKTTPTAPAALTDTFMGDDARLVTSIESLLALDAARARPRVGGHARSLLMSAAVRLSATPAAQAGNEGQGLTTCNCRWRGEKLVQQCELHEAWRDAIHDWAERAKDAEKKLALIATTPASTQAPVPAQGTVAKPPTPNRNDRDHWPAWIDENPVLFAKSVREFLADHPAEQWDCRISMFAYCIRLTATAKAPAPSQQAEPAGWAHENDDTRVISAAQKAQALRDGGASASSVAPYSIKLLAAAPAQPEAPPVKPLDDPRLQELFSTTIDGALTSGYQGVAPAPAGHWLEYWWNKGRAVAVEAPQPQGEAPVAWRMRSLALRHRAPSSSG